MTAINFPASVRQLRVTHPVRLLIAAFAVLLLVATAVMVVKGYLPTHSLLHGLDHIPSPIRHMIFH
jgi:hypothetical protein